MQLTKAQVEQMRAKGLSDEKIVALAKEKGYELPKNEDFLKKAENVVNKLGFAGKQVGQAIGTLGGYAYTASKEKLGLVPKGTTDQYDLSAPSPLQVAGDVARGALQVAGAKLPVANTILGKTTQFGALGAGGAMAKGVAEGDSAEQIAKETVSEGLKSALTGFTFGVLGKGLEKGTELVQKAGTKIQTTVIKPSVADIEDGFDINTIKQYDLGGTLQDTFRKSNTTLENLSKELNEKLATNKVPVDMNSVYEKTATRLLGSKLENFGTNSQMDNAVEKLREELVKTIGKNGIATIPEAQAMKRAAGHMGAWSYGQTDPAAKASEKVYNVFYNELKKAIEDASPEGVREINQQMSKIIPVLNAVIRRIPVAERNAGMSLTDVLTLTGAALEPSVLSLSLLNRAQKSGVVGKALSNVSGLGQGVVRKAEQVAQAFTP